MLPVLIVAGIAAYLILKPNYYVKDIKQAVGGFTGVSGSVKGSMVTGNNTSTQVIPASTAGDLCRQVSAGVANYTGANPDAARAVPPELSNPVCYVNARIGVEAVNKGLEYGAKAWDTIKGIT